MEAALIKLRPKVENCLGALTLCRSRVGFRSQSSVDFGLLYALRMKPVVGT